jgi:sarcosine oxidase, subunit alpha
MRGQPNRLAAATAGPFSGTAIDRSRALQFRLDGRTITGFAGDTVLSAVLAGGIEAVGRRAGEALALSTRFAPAIVPQALADAPHHALAMERTPATAGAEYVTLAPRRRRAIIDGIRRLIAPSTTLGLDLDRPAAMGQPWTSVIGAVETPADVIVVGGGVAGMAAAVAAAEAGLSVILMEASPRLGGYSRLFGTLDGEETADASFVRLGGAVLGSPNIAALTHASVFAARPGAVRVHITDTPETGPSARIVELHARHIVLATGSTERLPVFAGNRLPGTVGIREAYDLAQHYGVWCGQSALFATVSNAAYRLAMLARDAGIEVPRIIDARQQPQSRFIEFSKAYGITLAAGTIIADARPAAQGRGLDVSYQLAVGGFSHSEPSLRVDRLVVCGGWQPELSLWHMAGGQSHWNQQAQRLEGDAGPEGLVLAGNAAGYLGHQACLDSAQAAIAALLGREHGAVEEHGVEQIYESPDAPTPIAPQSNASGAACFLDAGRSCIERPQTASAPKAGWLPMGAEAHDWPLAEGAQALATSDIAAGVQFGAIAPEHAGEVARERVAMVAIDLRPTDDARTVPLPSLVPDYLAGRFGADAQLWLIKPNDSRRLEAGALIQPNSDASDPALAIGVVLRDGENGSIALLAADFARNGQTAAVREPGRATAVQLVEAYREE